MREKIDFESAIYGEKKNNSIIKVIGVGGGGGNAVKHMYENGIKGVHFMICNTDRQVLEQNQVPSKLVLGESGLGAGADPDVARELAEESREKIIEFIGNDTKMLFITAGMGKGTGTGAAPVIAEIAREMGILTIAVVTYPFKFEGKKREEQAKEGINKLKKYVDSIIVVKNQNIIKFFKDETVDAAFGYADDVLKNAVKCIAELITVSADQNIDFNDIESIMKQSGQAMLGLATSTGENRVENVVEEAFRCPLLEQDLITDAKNFLFFITYGKDAPLKISELDELTEKFESYKSHDSAVIWGKSVDESLGSAIKLSVIITNYSTLEEPEYVTLGNNIVEDETTGIHLGEKKENVNIIGEGEDYVLKEDPIQTLPQPSSNIEQPQTIVVEKESDFIIPPIPNHFSSIPTNTTMISTSHDDKFENDDAFKEYVGTPAIMQKQQQQNSVVLDDRNSKSFLEIDDMGTILYNNIPD